MTMIMMVKMTRVTVHCEPASPGMGNDTNPNIFPQHFTGYALPSCCFNSDESMMNEPVEVDVQGSAQALQENRTFHIETYGCQVGRG